MSLSTDSAYNKVLLVSPLPPPYGGVATWTSAVQHFGLSGDYRCRIVNTAFTSDRLTHEKVDLNTNELKRFTVIILRYIKQLFAFEPNLIHLNCCLSPAGIFRDLLVGILARMFGKKLVVHYRGHIPDFQKKCKHCISIRALTLLMRLATINIAVNRNSQGFISRMLGAGNDHKNVYVPNFIDDSRVGSTAGVGAHEQSQKALTCLYTGSLSVAKGFSEFIEVARIKPRWRFVAAGSLHRDCEYLMETFPANVTYLGEVQKEQIFALLAEADVFLFLSHSEGFPNSVVEAMAAGLPVVGTNVGAVPHMIDDGRGGFICEVGHPHQAAAALERLETDRLRHACGLYNISKVRNRYAYSIVIKQLCRVYDDVLAGKRSIEPQSPIGPVA